MQAVSQQGPSKGRKSQKKRGNTEDDLNQKMSSMSIGSSGDKRTLSLFPARPPRPANSSGPGNKVILITNLFKLSLIKSKPIYRYHVETHIEEDREKDETDGKAKQDATERVPKKLSRELLRAAVDEAVKTYISENKPSDYSRELEYNYVFDNAAANLYALFNMFTHKGIKSQEFRVKLDLPTILEGKLSKQARYFRVKIIEGVRIDVEALFKFCTLNPPNSDINLVAEHLKVINVLMRGKIQSMPFNVMTQTSVFPFKKDNQDTVSPGVMINKGYFMSTRPAECGVVLNVANTVAAFHEEIDLLELLRTRYFVRDFAKPLQPNIIELLKKEIRNKQVEARHKNYGSQVRPHYRKYRVGDIAGSSNDKFTLVDKTTKEISQISIAQYFQMEYKYKIKYPNMPCIVDKGRKLPIEVCHMIDKQRVLRKMTPDETAQIIRKAAVPPDQYFQQLRKNVEEIHSNSTPLNNFGIEFAPVPIRVEGRELMPLLLTGGTRRDIRPNEGSYDIRSDRFFRPAKLNKWGMLFLEDFKSLKDREFRDRQKFSRLYCAEGRAKGVAVPPLEPQNYAEMSTRDENQLRKDLKEYFKRINDAKVDHVIIVLPDTSPDWIYRYVQYLEVCKQDGRKPGESYTRISCLKHDNYMKKIINGRDNGKMFISNLWLKYNTKLGGINFVLKASPDKRFLKDGYLFLSVDVCHPAPGDKLIQSVAAVVGMWDLTSEKFSYCTRMRVQKKVRADNSTIEEVGELGLMFGDVLDSYYQRKKKYPTQIMVLRDGVSEGQFKIVLQYELQRIHQEVANKYMKLKLPPPKISCLVVQKRHRVRFMREKPVPTRKGIPDYNIQPGTVVDSKIVHPNDFSFYIAPHKAIQGTSRAAHIYIISNDIQFNQDEAQEMVHALSYLSPRCTKSTSIPTPVNLADLAAERGKNIVISWNDDHREKLAEKDRLEKLNAFLSNLADINYKNTLFYI